MIKFNPPELRKDFIIVVNRSETEFAAAAISYLFEPGKYVPVFAFPDVKIPANEPILDPDIYLIQRRNANVFSTFLNNAIIHNGGCENLLLLGLTDNQLSYLDFLRHYNVLEIESSDQLDAYLGGFAFNKNETLLCSSEQCFHGLILALQRNCLLKIGSQNETFEEQTERLEGIVIIERKSTVETIIAINYAISIGAQVVIVDQMAEDENEQVLQLLENWDGGDQRALNNLLDKVNSRIGEINFDQFNYVTFFTDGLPYSLSIHSIPVCNVNLKYQPDFFIHNAFKYELKKRSGSAVVFSPVFFRDEETEKLINLLEFKNYYVRKLTSGAATNYNLKNSIESYPFDLFHICSHGGDVSGTRSEVHFRGADGADHVIEFDFVLSIALTPYQDKHAVEKLYYFKKLDGLIWRSQELLDKGYPHEVYAGIIDAIGSAFEQKKVIKKYSVPQVPNANAIKCSDFYYFANFDQMASDNHPPLIFNNTCWSWMNVSTSFLTGGVRGYIGTLTSVPNDKAKQVAESFYDHVFDSNIIDAFYTAISESAEDGTLPLYIYWGLHFSTLNNSDTIHTNRHFVINELCKSLAIWRYKRDQSEGSKDLLDSKVNDTFWLLCDILFREN